MPFKWEQPVNIEMPSNGRVCVDGPFEALSVLSDGWQGYRGPDYVSARSFCRAAIAGRKSAEEAREIFIIAARQARIMQ